MFNQKQSGLTLIELMIAMVLGLFVSAVTISIFSTTVRSNVENMKMIRLNQELRGAMTMMVNELKRHGYSSINTNADFMNDFNFSSTCVRYSYDEIKRDPSGSEIDGVRDADERFGFKLKDNAIEWTRNGGDIGGTLGSPSCNAGTWTPITDPNLAKITTLAFNVDNSVNTEGTTGSAAVDSGIGVSIYEVTITLTGTTDLASSSDANDPSRTIAETIRIRNEAPK